MTGHTKAAGQEGRAAADPMDFMKLNQLGM
jgi:hypothetical protein